ncbi:MAG TPA: hypothetical protein VIF62_20735, partial [Labilithrix sp.]
MDYTKFLGKTERVVAPWLGGGHVFVKERRLRVTEPRPEKHGFFRFEVRGRDARVLEAADPEGLEACPKARGHLVFEWLVHPDGLDRLRLLPEEEAPPLSTTRARRWWSGDCLFESLDFDSEAEEDARLRLEKREPLADAKGVAATLRTAFGLAFAIEVAREGGTVLSVREAAPYAVEIAERGLDAATNLVERIARERREADARALQDAIERQDRARIRELTANAKPARGRIAPTPENAAARAFEALDGADARMLGSRRLANGTLEVRFELLGERFISVVDATTLHVYDSGICLAGADEMVTLDSLPGVIREAIDTG